jgi:hypothetical protein
MPRLQAWVSEYKPDVIFEMNRVGCELPLDELGIKHVSWVVDFAGRDLTQIHGSDIIYFFDPGAEENSLAECHTAWLAPGASPEHFFPGQHVFNTDFLFVGHMPAPWSESELNTLIGSSGNYRLTFSELLAAYLEELELPFDCIPTHKILKDKVRYIVEQRIGKTELTRKVEYDLLERLKRITSRQALVGAAAAIEFAVMTIYGSETWKQWPEYAQYFRGFLSEDESLRQAYASSRYCLHDGVGLHFRSMDCMASGGVILYRQDGMIKYTPLEGGERGLHTCFREGEHYLQFDTADELTDIYFRYKNDDAALRRIGSNAAQAVEGGHTWRHRAQQIVDDINTQL